MRHHPRRPLALLCLPLVASSCHGGVETGDPPAPKVAEVDAIRDRGRLDTERFYASELADLSERMTPAMLAEGGLLDELGTFRRKVDDLAGREVWVLDEEVFREGDVWYYRRTVAFDRTEEVMAVQWGYAADGAIADFFIRPIAPAASVEYRTRTPLRLPFGGEWYVTSGGRTLEQNQHGRDYSNRFAYDLIVAIEVDDAKPRREPSDYHTWEQPILAPAGGVVIGALNHVQDNPLSQTEGTPSIGNHVVIDHGNGEFSVLGHLRRGSLRVSVGDSVVAGRVIGLAGNSGNTNGPHLHYNLQDGPEPNAARGLPAQFLDYVADGEPVARGEPVRGQVIRHGAGGG